MQPAPHGWVGAELAPEARWMEARGVGEGVELTELVRDGGGGGGGLGAEPGQGTGGGVEVAALEDEDRGFGDQ